MNEIFFKKNKFGSLHISEDLDRNILLVCPKGIINPSLIKADLVEAEKFGYKHKKRWVYLVNTEDVIFPNPLNLLLLSTIKSLPGLKAYVIYAPSFRTRVLSLMISFILRPDLVLKTKQEFEDFKNTKH